MTDPWLAADKTVPTSSATRPATESVAPRATNSSACLTVDHSGRSAGDAGDAGDAGFTCGAPEITGAEAAG
jgi:hypothetical protein